MSAVLKAEDFSHSAPARHNIYTVIHKALRGYMTHTLLRWGRADMDDVEERQDAIAQVRALLDMCANHLRHENEFLHPALEAARVGGSAQTRREHVEHEVAITELRSKLAAVEAATSRQRAQLAGQFYLHLSAFIAENFEHMIVEETHNHGVLIEAYSDAQVLDIERRLVASLSPEESFTDLRWMIPHINAGERAKLLGGVKQGAPPEVFASVMALARELLGERSFAKLERALGNT